MFLLQMTDSHGQVPAQLMHRPSVTWQGCQPPAVGFFMNKKNPHLAGPGMIQLIQDLGDDAGTHGAAALAQRKAQARPERQRPLQLDRDAQVVARHRHAHILWQAHRACAFEVCDRAQ